MRTPRTGSESSGAPLSTRLAGSALAIMPSAAMRTEGSASCNSARAAASVPGLVWGCASVAAVARTIAGAAGLAASSSRPGKARTPCVSPACKVLP